MRGKVNRRIVAGACVMMALAMVTCLLPSAKCDTLTNYLDDVRDFHELTQQVERLSSHFIRRADDGRVEYIALGFPNDETLALISRQPSIKEIGFLGTRVTETGFAALRKMTNLSSLSLSMCGDARRSDTLELVSRLTQLRRLDVHSAVFKPSDLPFLMQMTNLEELKLRSGSTLGSNAISSLTNLPHLRKLLFGGWGDDFEQIKELRLNGVESQTVYDAEGDPRLKVLMAVTNLTSLEELEIYRFNVFGDEQLRKLSACPRLKSLRLDETAVSDNWTNIVSRFPVLTNAEATKFIDGEGPKKQKWVRKE